MSWIKEFVTGIGGRKLIVSVLGLAASTVLCWYGKIESGQFVTALTITVGGYLAANVTQKATAKQ